LRLKGISVMSEDNVIWKAERQEGGALMRPASLKEMSRLRKPPRQR